MEDSSPDLSLKLRRGSSDSRDSFYMDFAQGIDSDIEDIATTTSGTAVPEMGDVTTECDVTTVSPSTTLPPTKDEEAPSWPSIPLNNVSGGSRACSSRLGGGDPLLPSPASPTAVIVSPETLSHHSSSSPARRPLSSASSAAHHQKQASGSNRLSGISIGGVTPSCSHHHVSLSSPVRQPGDSSNVSSSRGGINTTSATDEIKMGGRNITGPHSHRSHHHPPHRQQQKQKAGPLAIAPLSFQHHHVGGLQLPALRRPSRVERQTEWKQLGADALATTLSALYGKLLVVMGTAFPMAEVISTYIPPSFYEWYYLYLYIGSMLFLLYMYTMLLSEKKNKKRARIRNSLAAKELSISDSGEESGTATSSKPTDDSGSSCSDSRYRVAVNATRRLSFLMTQTPHQYHYGSFYLRMGAVAFGIGSMIYSGLEFGQYFELERNTKCHNVMLALTPATRMAFIFIQMYFIFLTNEQMKVYKHKITARFGLMHMIGTNLSVWLNVLVQETKHEILTFYNPENNSLRISHRLGSKVQHLSATRIGSSHGHGEELALTSHHIVARGLKGPHAIYECRRTNIIGSLVQDASPFLFPCTIEYSLICAAILYVMWKNISKQPKPISIIDIKQTNDGLAYKKSPHHYSVDCARAHKGLFVGILILVLTIISLILFFVLISRPEFVNLAVMEVNICELTLYGVSTLASLIGMFQVRVLKYDGGRNLELDNILLIGAQTGMFIYSMFTIIGGQFTIEKNTILVVITALTSLVQTTFQTMFILDASRRSCVTPDQIRRKPGREIVTFLLVTNLAMWAISTLEKSRAESHPIQLHFYGLWAWTIITHVSMPLAIFYRFHSTVCLCEIWKRAYKMKPTYM